MGTYPALGQVSYPARVSTVLAPPHSIYLNDYTAPGAENLVANIQFNDFNEPSWEAALRIRIESSDVRIETRPGFRPTSPILLTPGVPVRLSGVDLAEYLDLRNIITEGITPQALQVGGRLPEGYYNFCIEVVDYRSGTPISLPSCAGAWLMLQDPPRVVSPMCESAQHPQNPQRITFNWQLPGLQSPMGGKTLYRLRLFEVTDEQTDPEYAMANGHALQVFESDELEQTTFIYDPSAPLLDLGKRYVFTVQAFSSEGRDVFKNQGYSKPCWFSYGYPTGGLLSLNQPTDRAAYGKGERPAFQWTAPNNTVGGQQYKYRLKIVQMTTGQNGEQTIGGPAWYETETQATGSPGNWDYALPQDLDPEYDYAWQVTAWSGEQQVASSPVRTFSGPALIDQFSAGDVPIAVKSTSNRDKNNLSGIALVRLSENETVPPIEVAFSGLKIVERAGFPVLEGGELIIEDPNVTELVIPAREEGNPEGVLRVEQFKVDKAGLHVRGQLHIPLPWAVEGQQRPELVTRSEWFRYEVYQASGNSGSDETQSYALLDPAGFKVNVGPDSKLNIIKGQYELTLSGEVVLPEFITSTEAAPVSLPFQRWPNLTYYQFSDLRLSNYLRVADRTGIELRPRRAVWDLSDDQSPSQQAGDKRWKGIYVEE